MKTIEVYFVDWEADLFGFGYGTGEQHVISSLKTFISLFHGENKSLYDYQILEENLTPPVAWLLINILCNANHITYGTSPRYGFLTKSGKNLHWFFEKHSIEELLFIIYRETDGSDICDRDDCNCDEVDCRVNNPFWIMD